MQVVDNSFASVLQFDHRSFTVLNRHSERASFQRLGLLDGLVAERAGLGDLGGQFSNPYHDPLLPHRLVGRAKDKPPTAMLAVTIANNQSLQRFIAPRW